MAYTGGLGTNNRPSENSLAEILKAPHLGEFAIGLTLFFGMTKFLSKTVSNIPLGTKRASQVISTANAVNQSCVPGKKMGAG
jgi:Na+/H+ antiporter NhaD/arsenite permease-like protein